MLKLCLEILEDRCLLSSMSGLDFQTTPSAAPPGPAPDSSNVPALVSRTITNARTLGMDAQAPSLVQTSHETSPDNALTRTANLHGDSVSMERAAFIGPIEPISSLTQPVSPATNSKPESLDTSHSPWERTEPIAGTQTAPATGVSLETDKPSNGYVEGTLTDAAPLTSDPRNAVGAMPGASTTMSPMFDRAESSTDAVHLTITTTTSLLELRPDGVVVIAVMPPSTEIAPAESDARSSTNVAQADSTYAPPIPIQAAAPRPVETVVAPFMPLLERAAANATTGADPASDALQRLGLGRPAILMSQVADLARSTASAPSPDVALAEAAARTLAAAGRPDSGPLPDVAVDAYMAGVLAVNPGAARGGVDPALVAGHVGAAVGTPRWSGPLARIPVLPFNDSPIVARPVQVVQEVPLEADAVSAAFAPAGAGLLGDVFSVDAGIVERGLHRLLRQIAGAPEETGLAATPTHLRDWLLASLAAGALAAEVVRRQWRELAEESREAEEESAWIWPSTLKDLAADRSS
jgi:hypothetical protein